MVMNGSQPRLVHKEDVTVPPHRAQGILSRPHRPLLISPLPIPGRPPSDLRCCRLIINHRDRLGHRIYSIGRKVCSLLVDDYHTDLEPVHEWNKFGN